MKSFLSSLRSLFHCITQPTNPLNSMPDFSQFTYAIVCPPTTPKIFVWDKLRECERRLEFYRWAESLNDPSKAQHRIILDDALAAFLLTFEASLQYAKDAFSSSATKVHFWDWLRTLPEYGLPVRGIRTIRHIEAHVRDMPIGSNIGVKIGRSLPGGKSHVEVSRTWRLPTLSPADLKSLRTPALLVADLPQWNALVEARCADSLLEEVLRKVQDIVKAAEAAL